MSRSASCSCGQLRLTVDCEPVRISICHCLECQKRTGSIFATQARFPIESVTIEGKSSEWSRTGDSGNQVIFHFCPVCGSTLCWQLAGSLDQIAVAVGMFADPDFPPPKVSVYEERQHPWALEAKRLPLDHQL